MRLLLILLLPFLGSVCAAFMPSNARNREAWFAGAVTLSSFLLLVSFYPQIAAGEIVRFSVAWLPQYGLTFGLRLDGYAWLFASLITFIGSLVVLYARYYMSPADPVPRFFAFLLSFMGAMVGMVLSSNLIQLVLCLLDRVIGRHALDKHLVEHLRHSMGLPCFQRPLCGWAGVADGGVVGELADQDRVVGILPHGRLGQVFVERHVVRAGCLHDLGLVIRRGVVQQQVFG